ncbi:MAG: hypothetical protein L0Y71_09980 [Gemmataceae bacterium]|nr:hypothetical protein [Gemmataceae bacterium]
MADMEREHILAALRAANGVLGGPHGAAARLAMNRTTLRSKLKKLGISHRPRPTTAAAGARPGRTSAAINMATRNRKSSVIDGPFAETREQLGG